MMGSFYLSTVGRLLNWARSRSLWYVSTGTGCCADEVLDSMGSRYDLERFGCLPQVDPRQADLLIVCGMVSYKAAPHLKSLYDTMLSPKYVLAVGACANCGGPFSPEFSYSVVGGVDQVIPVDVYVPGCPPRPEAIMNGLIALQEKSVDINPLIAKLNKVVPDAVLESRRFGRSGVTSIWLEADAIVTVAKTLCSDEELRMDWLENLSLVEFEDVLVATYFLTSSTTLQNLILRISAVPTSPLDRVCFKSTRSVWPMAAPMEREAEELFGVTFDRENFPSEEEPEAASNFLPENWIGFPLRKAYVFPKEVYGLPHARVEKPAVTKKEGEKVI